MLDEINVVGQFHAMKGKLVAMYEVVDENVRMSYAGMKGTFTARYDKNTRERIPWVDQASLHCLILVYYDYDD
jgi:hypothetical protein